MRWNTGKNPFLYRCEMCMFAANMNCLDSVSFLIICGQRLFAAFGHPPVWRLPFSLLHSQPYVTVSFLIHTYVFDQWNTDASMPRSAQKDWHCSILQVMYLCFGLLVDSINERRAPKDKSCSKYDQCQGWKDVFCSCCCCSLNLLDRKLVIYNLSHLLSFCK